MAKRAQRTKELTPVLKQYAAELFVDIVPNPRAAWARAHKALGLPVPKGNDSPYAMLRQKKFQKFAQQLRETSAIKTDTILAATELSVKRTETEIARLSYVDPIDIFDDDGNVRPVHAIPEHARRCIVGFENEELFDFSDDEDVRKRLDDAERAVAIVLAVADAMKAGELGALAVPIAGLRGWAKPKKTDGKRQKYLVGHLRKVKLADKKGALELAGRRDGIFKDKMIHEAGSSLEAIIAASHKVGA